MAQVKNAPAMDYRVRSKILIHFVLILGSVIMIFPFVWMMLTSVKGHPRPALAKEPCQITLLDAYRAVEGDKPLLHQDTHTNPACGVGVNIQLVLRDCYDLIQARAEESMRSITLQEILDRYTEKLFHLGKKDF